jgi:ribosomal protein L11 methyltransferase
MQGGRGSWPALIVSGLARAGSDGGELLPAALADYEIAAIEETSPDSWRVFFHGGEGRDRALAGLRRVFPHLAVESTEVADEDWAARSQAELRAVAVGKVIVAPPWDVPVTIVIQPSTGFGTGHHATTRLCLAALQRLELTGRTVLDIGTGSGVLAIAASRLGAGDVTGIDDDADAIRAAWDNLALNSGAQVTLITGDLRATELVPADVVLANLTGTLLIRSIDRLRPLVAARGHLILSGFTTHEEQDVAAAYAAFPVVERAEEEGWVCLTLAASP